MRGSRITAGVLAAFTMVLTFACLAAWAWVGAFASTGALSLEGSTAWHPMAAGGASPFDGPPRAWVPIVLFMVLLFVLLDFVKILIELIGRSDDRRFRTDLSQVTAVVPCRNGAGRLPGTVKELSRHLPRARIVVVDDASTDGTAAVARELGCRVYRFDSRKGKAAAIHYAVHRVETPLTLILDDDTRLGGARLPTSLITHEGFDAVAFQVLPDRRDRDDAHGNGFLGDIQRYEYGKSMEIGKRFHDATHSVSCVSGAVGLYRTEILHRLHHAHTGAFPGEDLQRTMIQLLNGCRVVFAGEPVWTIAPSNPWSWLRQRLVGWYPGLYHQFLNFVKLAFKRGVTWRLRYEMLYNLYTMVSDPVKTWFLIVIAITPGLRWWAVVIYLTYVVFELYPYAVIRTPGDRKVAPLTVLLAYPLYGAVNTLLRTLSLGTWFWMRFVSGNMRPRRGPQDRTS